MSAGKWEYDVSVAFDERLNFMYHTYFKCCGDDTNGMNHASFTDFDYAADFMDHAYKNARIIWAVLTDGIGCVMETKE